MQKKKAYSQNGNRNCQQHFKDEWLKIDWEVKNAESSVYKNHVQSYICNLGF